MKAWLALGALAAATALAAQTDPRSRLVQARNEAAAARQRSTSLEAQARSRPCWRMPSSPLPPSPG